MAVKTSSGRILPVTAPWVAVNNGKRPVRPRCSMMACTSRHMEGPWSFWPSSSSASMSAQLRVGSFAKASAHRRFRPLKHVVRRSAKPQLSCTVSGLEEGKSSRTSASISRRPRRITAAFVFADKPKPSQKPAVKATTFLSPPKSSTPTTSGDVRTLNSGVLRRRESNRALSSSEQASVASAKCPRATSLATLAPPMKAQPPRPRRSAMTWVPVRMPLPPSSTIT
mmetsp:Transcript_60696/g.195563  ORF Transcript_60696/g.195563 Transcript_60696/m.195563 type:complete len:225 (-) Transcript_60696:1413-2087(-)